MTNEHLALTLVYALALTPEPFIVLFDPNKRRSVRVEDASRFFSHKQAT